MKILNEVVKEINDIGGTVYIVGGAVRDELLGIENKDIDLEIYNITALQLMSILSKYGKVKETGKSFGVLMISGLDIDFAMPRFESKVGIGHRGFDVSVNPFISTQEASRRRDFTINALMKNALTGEIIDHWEGIEDLKRGVIRHIDDKSFVEDPLRAFRCAQFASRFNFEIDKDTLRLCGEMDVETLPIERIFEETSKALLKSSKPSVYFEELKNMGIISDKSDKSFSQLFALTKTNQSKKHHPEGNVWNHTMLVIDEASKLKSQATDPLAFMLSALLHDVGKITTTEEVDGELRSYGHAEAGAETVVETLNLFTQNKEMRAYIKSMTRWHMSPLTLYPNASAKALRRLALNVCLNDLILLAEADHKGRGASVVTDFTDVRSWFISKKQELNLEKKIQPIVTGKDLIAKGYFPGKDFKEILDKAFELQLEGLDKETIIEELGI